MFDKLFKCTLTNITSLKKIENFHSVDMLFQALYYHSCGTKFKNLSTRRSCIWAIIS